jgi:uncharacterized membrane protein YfcA
VIALDPAALVVAAVILAAVFTQSLVGFGSAMIAMALLSARLGLAVAAPLVALVALTLEAVVLARHARSFNLNAVWRLIAGALLGVPVGVLAVRLVPERVMLPVLGLVIGGYALYALWGRRLPALAHPGWALAAGALAGVLGGAYNTSGPPVILYGDCRRWPPAQFKSNLQGFFLVNDLMVLVGHAFAGNLTPDVWRHYLAALPAVALGLLLGLALERRFSPAGFRRLALLMLLALGARLLWPAG